MNIWGTCNGNWDTINNVYSLLTIFLLIKKLPGITFVGPVQNAFCR